MRKLELVTTKEVSSGGVTTTYNQMNLESGVSLDYQRLNFNSSGTANQDVLNVGNTVMNNTRTFSFFFTPTVLQVLEC